MTSDDRHSTKQQKSNPMQELRGIIKAVRDDLNRLETALYRIVPSSQPNWKRLSKASWKLSNEVYEQTLEGLQKGRWSFPQIHAVAMEKGPPAGFPKTSRTFMHYVQQHRRALNLKSHRDLMRDRVTKR